MDDRVSQAAEPGVVIPAGEISLHGSLSIPPSPRGVVVFAHGSGSGRFSPRNRFVASALREGALGTLLFDLLTGDEERSEAATGRLRFDVPFLASRLVTAIQWLSAHPEGRGLDLGIFGASTGAAAALVAAAQLPETVATVVSRGGRPDLAGDALESVRCPTLLLVGERDRVVLGLNQEALRRLNVEKRLQVIPNATHLFEEAGALEEVAWSAREWFVRYLKTGAARANPRAARRSPPSPDAPR